MFSTNCTTLNANGVFVRRHLFVPGNPTLILVALPWQRAKDPVIPFSHLSLVANLDKTKINLIEIVIPVNDPFDEDRLLPVNRLAHKLAASILAEIRLLPAGPIWIGFGVYTWNEPVVWETMRLVHQHFPQVRFVLGGPSITHGFEDLATVIPIPCTLIRGYAEFALPKVVLGKVDGLKGVYHSDCVVRQERTEFIWEGCKSPILTNPKDCIGPTGFVRWITKYGCRHNCSFCQYSQDGSNKPVERPWWQMKAELKTILARGVSELNIQDSIFPVGRFRTWEKILLYLIEHGYMGKLPLQCHFGHMPTKFLELCQQLNVQLEFGLQTAQPGEALLVNRKVNRQRIANVVKDMQKRGIFYTVSIIYGLPGQTLASFMDTVHFLQILRVPVIEAFPLSLYAGTELTGQREKWGYVTREDDPFHHVIASNTASEDDIAQMARVADSLRMMPLDSGYEQILRPRLVA